MTGFLVWAHVYLVQRLVLEPGLPEPWRSLAIGLVVVLGLTLVLQPIGERTLRPATGRWIAWPASLWMGFAFLLLLALWASDAVLFVAGTTASAASGATGAEGLAAPRAALVVALGLVATGFGLRSALRPPSGVSLEIPLARWPRALDGFRIVQISDIHIGPILDRRFAQHLVDRIGALRPDLIAITGDLVDGGVAQLAEEVAPLAALRAPHGVFFVTGNHDHYSGAAAWAAKAGDLGWRVLRNERVEIAADGAVFDVAGVDDHRGDMIGREGGEDLDAALAARDPERPCLLLAHDPSTFKRASTLGIDLQLSGHTHGGQIWPFRWFVRLAIPFVAGRYRRGDAELYVSRGTGFWGPPLRLFAPAEITEIVLRSA
jgi:predicted MPP superfamily phosphohydrolase